MKKRIFSIFLIMILAVTNMSVCYADALGDLTNIDLDNWQSTINADFSGGRNDSGVGTLGDDSDDSSGIMKLLVDILMFIPNKIVHALLIGIQSIVPSMDVIIFNGEGGGSLWGTFCQLTYFDRSPKGLAGDMVGYVSAFYQTFRYIALMGFVVAIAAIAVKMILSSVGKQKQQYKEALRHWLMGLCLLVVGHWIMIYMIYFSNYLVKLIYNIKEALLPGYSNSLAGVFADAVTTSLGTSAFMYIIALFLLIVAIIVFATMNLKIFKVYLERVVVVGVLIVIYPLVTVLYAFEKGGIKKGNTFESWLKTFVDQVFIQPIHAISMTLVLIALTAIKYSAIMLIPLIGVIVVLMTLNLMFSIENIVKRVFSINGAGMGSPIDPVGTVNKALGMAAPGSRQLMNDGRRAFGNARQAGKNWFKAGMAATGAMLKPKNGRDAIKSSFSGRYGMKNMQALGGMTGFSIPDEMFNVDRLSQKEQKDAARRIRNASATVDIKTVCGVGLHDDVRNTEFMMDQDLVRSLKAKYGVNSKMVNDYTMSGKGAGTADEVKIRQYMAALSDPTTDFSSLKSVDDLNYYFDASDNDVKRDLHSGKNISQGKKVDDNVIRARKKYALQHQDQVTGYMRAVGLTDDKIKAVEDGTSTSQADAVAYELLLRKCENPDINIDACRSSSGGFDATTVQNLDMSKDAIAKACKSAARADVAKGRKVYAATHTKEAQEIQVEVGISDAEIASVEDGTCSNPDVVRKYKVMVNASVSGNSVSAYKDSSGAFTDTIYNGVSMEPMALSGAAAEIVRDMPDVINDSASKEKARTILAGLKNKDKDKFARVANSVDSKVTVNDLNDFINGKTVSAACTPESILTVIEQLNTKK